MKLIKASGQSQLYSRTKLCNSLLRIGVSRDVVQSICQAVEKELRPGMGTKQLFQRTSRYLLEENPVFAAKYSLKQAMMRLGPEGFPFEQYVEAILREYGYTTWRNQIMKGLCVSHEIDVVAQKGDRHYLLEIKYHNIGGIKTDVQVVMYMYARLLDITEVEEEKEKFRATHEAWLVTNTKFTKTAIRYAQCQGITMTGWRYPKGASLEHLIAQKALYPVTVLPSLGDVAKELLLSRGILLARDLVSFSPLTLQKRFGLQGRMATRLIREAKSLI
jgi:Holliday junction resolvase-like predicted endonuclease